MLKPICVDCRKFYRVKKIGVRLIEGMPAWGGWKPYKLWQADLHECPSCKRQMITGSGAGPIAEHYQDNFAELVEQSAPIVTINDC